MNAPRVALLVITIVLLPTALIALGALGFVVGIIGAWLGRGLSKI